MDEDRKWLIVRVALVLSVVGLIVYGIYYNHQNRLDITKYNKDTAISANADNGNFDEIVMGDANAPITVIEYADYQCPACGRYKQVFQGLVNDYPGKVKLIFRNFILPSHTDARAASGVALAAQRQGKFWQVHAQLFERQAEWSGAGEKRTDIFEDIAKKAGMDLDKFHADLKSDEIAKKIKFDMELGKAHNLSATPTLIINGKYVDSEIWGNKDKLKQYMSELLK